MAQVRRNTTVQAISAGRIGFLAYCLTLPLAAVGAHAQDPDRDGLPDADEVAVYGTSELLRDSDEDGYGDGEEIARGSEALDALSVPRGFYLFSVTVTGAPKVDGTHFLTVNGTTDDCTGAPAGCGGRHRVGYDGARAAASADADATDGLRAAWDADDQDPGNVALAIGDLDGDGIRNDVDTDVDGDGIPNWSESTEPRPALQRSGWESL